MLCLHSTILSSSSVTYHLVIITIQVIPKSIYAALAFPIIIATEFNGRERQGLVLDYFPAEKLQTNKAIARAHPRSFWLLISKGFLVWQICGRKLIHWIHVHELSHMWFPRMMPRLVCVRTVCSGGWWRIYGSSNIVEHHYFDKLLKRTTLFAGIRDMMSKTSSEGTFMFFFFDTSGWSVWHFALFLVCHLAFSFQ